MEQKPTPTPTPAPTPHTPPTPPSTPTPTRVPRSATGKTDGPDVLTAVPVEGRPVVQTSMGPMDRDTVMNNRVGGTGWVSIQYDPLDAPNVPPLDGPTALKDESHSSR